MGKWETREMRTQILMAKMGDLPVGYRSKLRELTIGPVAWGLWSLTHHDGSTWAAVAFDGDQRPENITGWAAVTLEWDGQPVIGAYTSEGYRCKGIGSLVVTTLLNALVGEGILQRGGRVCASTWRWPRYFELVEACGLVCHPWE